MLDLRRLEVLSAVARAGSISAAAQELYLTPSAVSQQMAGLERELAVPLLVRGARGVTLTPAGRLLASGGDRVLSECAALERQVREHGAGSQVVRVGAFPTAGLELVPRALRRLQQGRPDLQVELSSLADDQPLDLLRDGRVDVLLMFDYDFDPRPVDPAFEYAVLADDPLMALLPSDHRLADRDPVDLHDLGQDPWVVRSHRPPYTGIHEHMFRLSGITPKIAFAVDDFPSLQGLVAAGVGVAVVPGLSITRPITDLHVRAVHPALTRTIYVVTRPGLAQDADTAQVRDALLAA